MLNLHSCYSLRYGVLSPAQLVDWVDLSGYDRVALTDINNTSASLSYIRLMQQKGKVPIVGIDFRNGIDCCFIGIARNNEGFMELNRLLSEYNHSGIPFPGRAPIMKHCYVIYPWKKEPELLREYEFIGVATWDLNRFSMFHPENPEKYVALSPMSFLNKQHFNTHRLLRSIDCNVLLSRLKENQQARPDELFLIKELLESHYSSFPELIQRGENLLNNCSVHFDFGDDAEPQNLATYTGSEADDYQKIFDLCNENLPYRYGTGNTVIHERIKMELTVIREKKYLSYFLIAWDIVSYARQKGYFYVGRGSGANSIIAYLLGITDVDPLELDLYFERFINLYRKNPPDFDIDFSWRDRDDINAYIFKRFPNSAMICTYNTFQYKATIRELGKVFGLPKADIDRLSADKPEYHQADEVSKLILKYSSLIAQLPSHLSVHAGGVVICEKPVYWFTATFLTSKGFPTTQFSMLEAEDVGLYKFDILSQRGLGKIKDCLDIVKQNQPENPPRDIRDIQHFKTDPNINQLLSEAKAIGCFYIESPGMRMLMTKLKTRTYLELVAASSIIRPGVAQSGMMREYILRHRIPEQRQNAHPKMLELMPDTYGVMVYQEDVIKVASQFAGLSLAESDILRRGMSGKFRSRDEFRYVRDRFFNNCIRQNYSIELIREIWAQIESFAGFAFSKGHSASYAVESYQSLYLKTYYPLEYMVATINNAGGFYRPEIYVHEARMHGGTIEPPCINRSEAHTTITGTVIFLGFQHIQGLELGLIEEIIKEREERGPFTDFNQLNKRCLISLDQQLLLIKASAFRTFLIPRKELIWKAHLSFNKEKRSVKQTQLFSEEPILFSIPVLEENKLEEAFDQLELLGFPLSNPFALLDEVIPESHPRAFNMHEYNGRQITTFGYHVNTKRTTTKKDEGMLFGTFIDVEGAFIDTVHFPDAAQAFPFRGPGVYEIRGVVTSEFDFLSIEVNYMRKINLLPDPRYYSE